MRYFSPLLRPITVMVSAITSQEYSISLLRIITVMVSIVTTLIITLPPFIHLLLSLDHANKELTLELRTHGIMLNKFIRNNPDIWHSHGIRMKAVLEDIHTPNTSVRVIYSFDGLTHEAGQMLESLPWPRLTLTEKLYDFGLSTHRN